MTLLVFVAALPWVVSLAIRMNIERIDRRFTPSTAVVLFPILAVVTAFSIVASMVAIAAVLVSSPNPFPIVLGVALLGWVLWRSIEVSRHLRRVAVSSSMAARFGAEARTPGGTVLVDSAEPDAFAVPSGGGAVVVTTGLAEALSDAELRAVIEHERAHLRFRHALWIQLCEIAAQFDPVLRPLVVRVRHAAERQADEYSATFGRNVTVSALARTALLRTHLEREVESRRLASTGGDVVRRVHALTEPPPARQRYAVVVAGLVVIAACASISIALFDVAQDVIVPEVGETPSSVFQ
ncbi:peptidase M48, Ste24p [Rhodococcus sp. 1163]|uniref:M56 family metallopeptidase n=1 Tax=Rhodococcus sp. 1163 TaxID=1905289 RepID=UPI000A0097EE|nr:M56 family metallopeptidase [Rhodococcus sp. 1163]ORI19451.1 peptidase M48, Ste24p [Rhodococcus sp. 1163]